MQLEMPIPPSQGCMVFQTPREPRRIFCPIAISIKKSGMPSKTNMIRNGMRKAPVEESIQLVSGFMIIKMVLIT